jgi:hypothetical protein
MKEYTGFIEEMIARNGPEPGDYAQLDAWFSRIHALAQRGATGSNGEQRLTSLY